MVAPGLMVNFLVDDRDLQRLLIYMEMALQPMSIAAFLGGPIDEYMQERHESRFLNEGDEVTGPWMPLKPATQAIRSSLGYGAEHPINVRTGELEEHIIDPGQTIVHPWGASVRYPGAPTSGLLEDKLRTAQQGDERTVPRPVLGLGLNDLSFVVMSLTRYIESAGRLGGGVLA